MPPDSKSKTLVAKWKPEQDCSVELPYTIYWSDGSIQQPQRTIGITSWTPIPFSYGAGGVETAACLPRSSPTFIMISLLGSGFISGDGVQPAALDISDRSAPDDSISGGARNLVNSCVPSTNQKINPRCVPKQDIRKLRPSLNCYLDEHFTGELGEGEDSCLTWHLCCCGS